MIIDPKNLEEKKLIKLINPKNKVVLEIGCGKGRQAFLLAPFCKKYIATDINKNTITINKKKITKKLEGKLEFDIASGDKLPYSSNTFDIVLLILCLHEIPIQKQGLVLQEIYRVLKDNGQLLIVDPTEPPDQVQQIFNIVYNHFELFDHSAIVKHSIWSIKKAISNGLFKTNKISSYKVDWKFDNLAELISFVTNCYPNINWDENKKLFLEKEFNKFIKLKQKNNPIVIFDGLTVNNLTKIHASNN